MSDQKRNPFVGPRSFRPDERKMFHGRDREATAIADLLVAERVLLVYSPSGAGKTSLLRAKVVPLLEEQRFRVLPIARLNLHPSAPHAGGNRYLLSTFMSVDPGREPDGNGSNHELVGVTLRQYIALTGKLGFLQTVGMSLSQYLQESSGRIDGVAALMAFTPREYLQLSTEAKGALARQCGAQVLDRLDRAIESARLTENHALAVLTSGKESLALDDMSSDARNALLELERQAPAHVLDETPVAPGLLATAGLEAVAYRRACWKMIEARERLEEMTLADYFDERAILEPPRRMKVLILDQFEDLFTVDDNPDDRERQEFAEEIGQALQDVHTWVLLSMREDYLGQLDPLLSRIKRGVAATYRLDLLTREQAREAAEEPARKTDKPFSKDALESLLSSLDRVRRDDRVGRSRDGTAEFWHSGRVEPIHLQIVCRRLWEENSGPIVKVDESTTVDDALGRYYAGVVENLSRESGVSERRIREWFGVSLITRNGVRLQVLGESESSAGLENAVVERLIDACLVRADVRGGRTWFELAHDRLVAPIVASNSEWSASHLLPLQLRANLWREGGERPADLLPRGEIGKALAWLRAHENEAQSLDVEFIRRSEDALIVRRHRQLKWLAAIVCLAFVALAASLAVSWSITESNKVADRKLDQLRSLLDHHEETDLEGALAIAEATRQDFKARGDYRREAKATGYLAALCRANYQYQDARDAFAEKVTLDRRGIIGRITPETELAVSLATLAEAEMLLKNYAEARDAAAEAVALFESSDMRQPDFVKALSMQALAEARLGHWQVADKLILHARDHAVAAQNIPLNASQRASVLVIDAFIRARGGQVAFSNDNVDKAMRFILLEEGPNQPTRSFLRWSGANFEEHSNDLPTMMKCHLDEVAMLLLMSRESFVVLDGHSAVGEGTGVSRQRASRCAEYLVTEQRVEPQRILIRWYDDSCPAPAGAPGRRVDVYLMTKGSRPEEVDPRCTPVGTFRAR